MGQDISHNETNRYFTFLQIKAENIHSKLNELYTIITSKAPFENRKRTVKKIYKDIQPYINIYYPHMFQFIKDCYGTEYFIFIATIGRYAIDMVMYYDMKDWIVLNSGMNYRLYNIGGTSKLRDSVSERSEASNMYDIKLIEKRIAEVDKIKRDCDYKLDDDTIIDFRCQPKIKIINPRDGDEVDREFKLVVDVDKCNLREGYRYYKVLVNGKEYDIISNRREINMRLRNGMHRIQVILYDSKNRELSSDQISIIVGSDVSSENISVTGCKIHDDLDDVYYESNSSSTY